METFRPSHLSRRRCGSNDCDFFAHLCLKGGWQRSRSREPHSAKPTQRLWMQRQVRCPEAMAEHASHERSSNAQRSNPETRALPRSNVALLAAADFDASDPDRTNDVPPRDSLDLAFRE